MLTINISMIALKEIPIMRIEIGWREVYVVDKSLFKYNIPAFLKTEKSEEIRVKVRDRRLTEELKRL